MAKAKKPTCMRNNAVRDHHKKPDGVAADLPPNAPEPPEYLTESAKAEWRFIVKCFETYDLFTKADASLLELYCRYMAKWREGMTDVEEKGMILSNGCLNPMLSACNNMMNHIQKLLVQLGLTPAARNAIRVANPKEEIPEDLKKFMEG